jgi:hypothetical protein
MNDGSCAREPPSDGNVACDSRGLSDFDPVMNAQPTDVIHHARPWPLKALVIWLIDACAIVVLSLVMLVVNEFRHQPGDATPK